MTITGIPELNSHKETTIELYTDWQDVLSLSSQQESTGFYPTEVIIKLTKEQALRLAEELIKLANEK